MTHRVFLLTVIGLLLLNFSCPLLAQESTGSGVTWNGYLQTDNRLQLKSDNDFSLQEYRLDLKTEANPTEKAHFYSEVWLRSLGFPTVQNSADLVDKNKISPLSLDFREAYVDLYGFLFNNLDIRIGRQRIAWGTADKLNPTDNLNPDDLEDIWDFGRHLGSNALKASYYLGNCAFEVVYIPMFTPAVLPQGDWASVLSSSMELPAGLTLRNLTDTIIMPKNNFEENSIIGGKISNNFFGYDFSLSYVYGRDDLPLTRKVTFTPTSTPGEVDITSELIYPRMHIAGIDMAGDIAGVGVWAEAAVFFPEEVKMVTDLSALGMGIQESIALDDKPYVKYVLGADYTFKNGIYINGQYLHGFVHERGKDNLEDYFMFGLEKKFFNDKLKIIPIVGGIEIKDFKDIENNYAFILSPEIAYFPVDNAELTLGIRLIDGKDTTIFGRLKDKDELYFKVKYSF
ncbi:MAG: hypothetical protein QME48_06475 [bacterium]|uniref:DUF1302 domain-containing protein n=2 Tax=Bacteria candidate phyla TaxID=1783234 RepID=A0A101I3N6_UNCT6|nr:MAG: hypothetical protein XD76_0129 [candidate division TA06 bacterium 32_111]KUK88055.1 MAG: hypothetical protein XE03_0061 [candidate division TA06 bacterium 34_109]MDI6700861.1 hypothetical protein [bacterium]HAF06987.1 hypothetical protein [candidate division WOR-3 bacterium]HCP16901.1 hypothetical protein [candidate division WOR-3 bacterium]